MCTEATVSSTGVGKTTRPARWSSVAEQPGCKHANSISKIKTINFRNKIENFPKCNYALLHSGNPFLHIILRDQIDNSTYSIKNLSNRDLMICPQIIGSNSSMLRILDLISKRISEFEIVDYDQYSKDFHETVELQ